jgi:hypothetical protein
MTTAIGGGFLSLNKNIDPEYSLSFNAGIEYARPLGFIQINGYYSELFDEITYYYNGEIDPTGASVWVKDNIARSLRGGLDAEGRLTVLKHGFVSTGHSWLFAWCLAPAAGYGGVAGGSPQRGGRRNRVRRRGETSPLHYWLTKRAL